MPLTKLFNLSFSLAEVSLTWKRANVTTLFKDNTKENVENYRSISLLSILGKCQESVSESESVCFYSQQIIENPVQKGT